MKHNFLEHYKPEYRDVVSKNYFPDGDLRWIIEDANGNSKT